MPTQFFAMKVLKKQEVVRLKQVEHVISEKQILALVKSIDSGRGHPFIVNLIASFQDDRCLFMLEEYVQGGELFSHLRRAGRFTNDITRFYIAEILLAIEFLHSMEIVYRDLKPENLLLDWSGHVKITGTTYIMYRFRFCKTNSRSYVDALRNSRFALKIKRYRIPSTGNHSIKRTRQGR